MKLKIYFGIISWCALLIFSCKKADPDLHLAVSTPTVTISNIKSGKATVNWSVDDDKISSFTVTLSKSSTFASTIKTTSLTAGVKSLTLDSLDGLTTYYVRVQALTGDVLYDSHYGTTNFISSEIENILSEITDANITETSVTLNWTTPAEGTPDRIVVTPDGGTALTFQLTAAEVSARTKTITGLTKATAYTAQIYAGTDSKGKRTFGTAGAAITINSATTKYATLQAAVDAAVSGDIIYLTAGLYDFSSTANETVTIKDKSLTIQATASSDTKPQVTMKNFDLRGNIASLKIQGIKIISTSNVLSTGSNTDYNKHILGATYLTGSIVIDVEDCDLSGAMSGLIFTQTVGATSSSETIPSGKAISLTVNNCLLHDFGNAGGDFIDFRSGTLNSLIFKNSTFYNGARIFFRVDAGVTIPATTNTLSIESSTFYNFCSTSFISLKAANMNVIVNKCNLSTKVGTTANAVSGTSTTLKFTTNNIFSAASAYGISTSNTSTTNLDPGFTSASTGNFTITNATIKTAQVGDPRWL